MGKKYKLGVIGFAHMHVLTLMAEFAELPNVEWVACADTKAAVPSLSDEPGKGEQYATSCRVHRNPQSLPGLPGHATERRFDIVIVCAKTSDMVRLSQGGQSRCHIVVEKPMATTMPMPLEWRKAQHNNVSLAVTGPVLGSRQ